MKTQKAIMAKRKRKKGLYLSSPGIKFIGLSNNLEGTTKNQNKL
jgi:hypothetical protein